MKLALSLPTSVARIGLSKESDYFIENLALLVASGMTIVEALDAVKADMRSKRMRAVIDTMRGAIEDGSPLWKALDTAELFPAHAVSLIRVGEESGTLSKNLRVVSQEQQKERVFRSRIRSAMLYPVFVLGLTVVIGTGVAWFILPKLAVVFSQMHTDLPAITRVLIDLGTFLGLYGAYVVPGFLLFIGVVLYVLFFARKTKHIGQELLLYIPGVCRLITEVELARFGYLLGTLLDAGVPVVRAISSVVEAASSPRYYAFYTFLERHVEDGDSFQKSFAAYPKLSRLIPTPIQQLIVSGERSGHLASVLLEVSADFEEKSETTTKNLSIILEPVLLVIVWLGVVAVALAVILPIYSLVGSLNTAG